MWCPCDWSSCAVLLLVFVCCPCECSSCAVLLIALCVLSVQLLFVCCPCDWYLCAFLAIALCVLSLRLLFMYCPCDCSLCTVRGATMWQNVTIANHVWQCDKMWQSEITCDNVTICDNRSPITRPIITRPISILLHVQLFDDSFTVLNHNPKPNPLNCAADVFGRVIIFSFWTCNNWTCNRCTVTILVPLWYFFFEFPLHFFRTTFFLGNFFRPPSNSKVPWSHSTIDIFQKKGGIFWDFGQNVQNNSWFWGKNATKRDKITKFDVTECDKMANVDVTKCDKIAVLQCDWLWKGR